MVGSAKKSDVELQVAEGSQTKVGEQLAAIKFRAIASPGKVAGLHNDGKVVMEVRALTKNVRISPEKARHLSRLIQGKSVVEALAIVDLSPRKAAALLGKTLRSAVANAENNRDVNRQALTVKAALVSPGPIIKRFRPKARGSAGRIRKRTSHLEVILTD